MINCCISIASTQQRKPRVSFPLSSPVFLPMLSLGTAVDCSLPSDLSRRSIILHFLFQNDGAGDRSSIRILRRKRTWKDNVKIKQLVERTCLWVRPNRMIFSWEVNIPYIFDDQNSKKHSFHSTSGILAVLDCFGLVCDLFSEYSRRYSFWVNYKPFFLTKTFWINLS